MIENAASPIGEYLTVVTTEQLQGVDPQKQVAWTNGQEIVLLSHGVYLGVRDKSTGEIVEDTTWRKLQLKDTSNVQSSD